MSDLLDFAIVVGINNYPDYGLLKGPEYDADDFYLWLIEDAKVSTKNIKLIKSSDYSTLDGRPQPAFDDIDQAFIDLINLSRKNGGGFVGNRLYIYMSGHGVSHDIDEASLIMANAIKFVNLPSYPGKRAAVRLRKAAMFKEIVLFMDCCRDMESLADRHPLNNWKITPDPGGSQVKYCFGYATKWTQKAREVYDVETNQIRGRFTKALLKGLRGGLTTTNKEVTSQVLSNFVFNYLTNEIPIGDVHYQEPEFHYNDNDQIIFSANLIEEEVLINFFHKGKATANDPIEVLDSSGKNVVKFEIGSKLTYKLPPGMYEVLLEGESVKTFDVIGKEVVDVTI